jgi:putative transposase
MTNIKLTKTQQTLLTNITLKTTSSQRLVFRAKVILTTTETGNKHAVAAQLKTSRDAVYRWTNRWQDSGEELARLEVEHTNGHLSEPMYQRALADVLADAIRPGHPATFTEEQKQQIIALAAEEPEKANVPITNWTCDTLRNAVIDKEIVPTISRAHIGRFLKQSHAQTSSK